MLAVAVAGCQEPDLGGTSATAGPAATSTTRPPEPATDPPATTTLAPTTVPPGTSGESDTPPCLSGDIPFSDDDGVVAAFDDGGGDAATIAGLRWSIEEGCERFVIDLVTSGGAPASTIGATRVQLQAGRGIVRIELPAGVDASAIADALVDGTLIRTAYVISRVDGSMMVDLHLDTETAVAVRGFRVTSPVRVVVDVRSLESGPAVMPPLTGETLVLVAPRDGPADYPIQVDGYVRDDGIEVSTALAPDSPDRIDGIVTVATGEGTWVEFAAAYDSGPTGTVELQVAADGDGAEPDEIRALLALD